MRIWFEQDKKKVVCCVKEYPGDRYRHWIPSIVVEQEWAANLLVKHFNESLGVLMESERRHYYNLGWKHAKAKRKKKTWFIEVCSSTFTE